MLPLFYGGSRFSRKDHIMNNFIFICEDDLKDLIKEAVILAVLYGNNHDNYRKDNHHAVHKSKKN